MSGSRWIFAGVLTAVVGLAACTNPQQNPQGDYGTVQGIVSSSAGPIAGAQVCIDVTLCATSAADGSYKIVNVPGDPAGGTEPVTATAAGYQNFSGQVHINQGTTPTPYNITMIHA
jgi:Carboxypeptidase regulatory-like domain